MYQSLSIERFLEGTQVMSVEDEEEEDAGSDIDSDSASSRSLKSEGLSTGAMERNSYRSCESGGQ